MKSHAKQANSQAEKIIDKRELATDHLVLFRPRARLLVEFPVQLHGEFDPPDVL